MYLSIPTDWSDALLEGISALPVAELYGSLPATVCGSGRATTILPEVSAESAKRHIRQARRRGLSFNYLLNSSCFGNREASPSFRKDLHEHLTWAERAGADTVTVANLFALDFVRTHFPNLKIKTSVFMAVPHIPTLKSLQESGAHAITLRQTDNRNFEFLEKVKKALSCEVILLANVACAYDCPAVAYHANTSSHDSQTTAEAEAGTNSYPILRCTVKKLTDPRQLIRARWIRPEDIAVYEAMGFYGFKLAGRDTGRDWILNATSAYSNRKVDGNLTEVLDGFHYLRDWQRRTGNVPFSMPYLDNRKLDGFIEHFTHQNCTDLCDDCEYCDRVAANALSLHEEENRLFIDIVDAYLESKRMF